MQYGDGSSYTVTMDGPFGNTEDSVRVREIAAAAADWKGAASPFSQVIDVEGVSVNSKIDIQLTVEQLEVFHDQVIAFSVENSNGVITLYAIGDKPSIDCTFQASVTEVSHNGSVIWGNTCSTTQARADYAEDDPKKSSFILNKPNEAISKVQKTAENAKNIAEAALARSGGTMTGALNMGSQKLTGLPAPVDDTDAVGKAHMESYVAGKRKSVTVTLLANGWADNKQTVSVAGVTADETKTDVITSVKADNENYEAYVDAGIRPFSQTDGGVTFMCSDVPTKDISVSVMVLL